MVGRFADSKIFSIVAYVAMTVVGRVDECPLTDEMASPAHELDPSILMDVWTS